MIKKLLLLFTSAILLCSCDDEFFSISDIAALIEGEWIVDEQSQFLKNLEKSNYRVNITVNTNNDSEFQINNFYQIGEHTSAEGKITNSTLVLNPNQEISDGFGSFTIISGSGSLSDNNKQISWTYKIDDGSGTIDNVTATFSKLN